MKTKAVVSAAVLMLAASAAFAQVAGGGGGGKREFEFKFVDAKVDNGPDAKVLSVGPSTAYSASQGYGYDLAPKSGGSGAGPAVFAVKVPEGTYKVTLTIGGEKAAVTTVKSECRQLQVENLETKAGETRTVTIAVNTRNAKIAGSDRGVGLKKAPARNYDEATNPRWDDRISFEFNAPSGSEWAVSGLKIEPADDLPVVYLVGDSTVCDQSGEPFSSWGQSLPRFLDDGVAVANHAESGEAYSSFLGERRWDKILTTLKKGDYVLMQMGHNDQKSKEPNYANAGYKSNAKKLVTEARAKGAIPVLLTPMHRHQFEGGKVRNSLGDFPDAMRALAKEENVLLIDLNAMSAPLYEAFGPERSLELFALSGDKRDHTHHNNFGSYELAKCVAEGIRTTVPELAKHLRKDFTGFDPARPDALEKFAVPKSPNAAGSTPAGS